jgi:hypothetical protein
MSESRLRAFAEQAELLVDLPDVEALERRGSDVRARRRTTAAAVALLVAIGGTVAVQERFQRADEPDKVDTPGRPVVPYPGNQMHDLAAGTYELTPSSVRGDPTALITLPTGWNSWEGPNRFDGHQSDDPTAGRYNDVPLASLTWYVGVLVVKVLGISEDACLTTPGHYRFVETYAESVAAFSDLPGYRMVAAPREEMAFGRRATHLVLRPRDVVDTCVHEAGVFLTSANGDIGGEEHLELWVVDVDGVPLTVMKGATGEVPPEILAEQSAVVDSIVFRTGAEDG